MISMIILFSLHFTFQLAGQASHSEMAAKLFPGRSSWRCCCRNNRRVNCNSSGSRIGRGRSSSATIWPLYGLHGQFCLHSFRLFERSNYWANSYNVYYDQSIYEIWRCHLRGPFSPTFRLCATSVRWGDNHECVFVSYTRQNEHSNRYNFSSHILLFLFRSPLGLLNLGFIIEFISGAVISGFTSAGALTIAATQLKGLTGIKVEAEHFFEAIYQLFARSSGIRFVKFFTQMTKRSLVNLFWLFLFVSFSFSFIWDVIQVERHDFGRYLRCRPFGYATFPWRPTCRGTIWIIIRSSSNN